MKIKATVKLRAYEVISRAVESGVNWGWQHAHKHDDGPSEDTIKSRIVDDVMSELCELIDFGD